jgi:hypothetical protein
MLQADLGAFELASNIKTSYPDKNVTIVDSCPLPLSFIFGSTIAKQLIDATEAKGVKVITAAAGYKIESEGAMATGVTVTTPDEFRGPQTATIPADYLHYSPAVENNTEMVPPNLMYPDGSVQVNGWLQTANADIFAVGDIAKYPAVILQNWFNTHCQSLARDQGIYAAHNMLGMGVLFSSCPWFSVGTAFMRLDFVGFAGHFDWEFTESDNVSDPTQSSKITYLFKGDVCTGAAIANKTGAAAVIKVAIERGLMPSKKQLAKGEVKYVDILKRVQASSVASTHN